MTSEEIINRVFNIIYEENENYWKQDLEKLLPSKVVSNLISNINHLKSLYKGKDSDELDIDICTEIEIALDDAHIL